MMHRVHPRRCQMVLEMARRWHQTSLTTELIEHMDKKATWDRFYSETNSQHTNKFKNFEWFFGFDAVQDIILPLLKLPTDSDASVHILDMGCGTSALGPSIYKHTPWPVVVTCVDISPVAVKLMQEHTKRTPVKPQNPLSSLAFLELDCTRLKEHFRPQSLDLIVDKGTTDALLRSRDGQVKAGQILRQCLGVLRSTGSLIQLSDEDPDARILWLEKETLGTGEVAANVGVQEVGLLRGVCYYCYEITSRNSTP
ncbi:citrate synthase-lysine N-methyltransferase CSKMT, mitochondrial [Alosa sapidissima]|uniref:citrate synthase-lysine N-methyltransferase CSKMT, mitochondrial n=1 Tax=Alosa sapidissima TaxID=34773 RepID=UPI001C0A6685|nr:citrate synthase-lysine N-methyltransferase CSKMT, mitochondrial [Alosa sapidissima]